MARYSWMPEDQYRNWQAQKFTQEAEATTYEQLASQLLKALPEALPAEPEPSSSISSLSFSGFGQEGIPPPPPALPTSAPPVSLTSGTSSPTVSAPPLPETPQGPLPDFLPKLGQEVVDFGQGFGQFLRQPLGPIPAVEEKGQRIRQIREGPGSNLDVILRTAGVLSETNIPQPVQDVMQVIPPFSGMGLMRKAPKGAQQAADILVAAGLGKGTEALPKVAEFWYHAAPASAAETIAREGIAPGSFFARTPAEALPFALGKSKGEAISIFKVPAEAIKDMPPPDAYNAKLWETGGFRRSAEGITPDLLESAGGGAAGGRPPAPPGGGGFMREVPPSGWEPTGRIPGGPERMTPHETISTPLEMVRESLTPPTEDLGTKVGRAAQTFIRQWYDKNQPLQKLEEITEYLPWMKAKVVPHMRAKGQWIIQEQIEPVLSALGTKGLKNLEEFMNIERMEDVLRVHPSSSLPGGVPGIAGVVDARAAFKNELGQARWQEIKDVAETLWDANRTLVLAPLKREGFFTDEAFRAITANNPHYLDWHRLDNVLDEALKMGSSGKPVATISKSGIDPLTLTGSTAKLDQPLARTMAQIVTVQERIAKNQAGRELYMALKERGVARLLDAGEDFSPTKDFGVLSFFQDGKLQRVVVPEPFGQIAKGLPAESSNIIMDGMRQLASGLRAGATTYNPAFLVVNPIRDFMTAAWQGRWRDLVSPDYIKGWAAALTKNTKFGDAASDGALLGGLIDSFQTTPDLARIAGRRFLGLKVDSPLDAITFIPRLIRELNTASEQATRIAVHSQEKARLVSQGLPSDVAGLRAAVKASDITIDFTQSGYLGQLVNGIIPFTNAGLEATGNIVKTIRRDPVGATLRATPLMAASTGFFLHNQRYETAKDIPGYVYANSWPIIIGEGIEGPDPRRPGEAPKKFPIYVEIPKGPLGGLLTLPVEIMLRFAWEKNDKTAAYNAMETAVSVFRAASPVDISLGSLPGIGTFAQGLANRDVYRDMPIVPRSEENRPTELRYGPDTSKTAVAIGQAIGQSPRIVEFAIRDMAAGTGGLGLWLMDAAMGSLGYNPPIPGEARRQPRTDIQALAGAPVIGRFLGTSATATERAGWDAFNKSVEESRRQFTQNKEVLRLGLNLGEVPDRFTDKGQERLLSMEERTRYQQESIKVGQPAVDVITASNDYKKADDAGKADLIQEVMSLAREQVRRGISQGKEIAADPKELAFAVRLQSHYRSIPTYKIPGTPEDQKMVERILTSARTRAAKLPESTKQKTIVALGAIYREATTDEDRKLVTLAATIARDPEKYSNSKVKKAFDAKYPIRRKYYGAQADEEPLFEE